MSNVHSPTAMKGCCSACTWLADATETTCELAVEVARKIAETATFILSQLGVVLRSLSNSLRYATHTSMRAIKAHPQLFVSSMLLALFFTTLAYSNDQSPTRTVKVQF